LARNSDLAVFAAASYFLDFSIAVTSINASRNTSSPLRIKADYFL